MPPALLLLHPRPFLVALCPALINLLSKSTWTQVVKFFQHIVKNIHTTGRLCIPVQVLYPITSSGAQRTLTCQCSLPPKIRLTPSWLSKYSAPGFLTSLLSFPFFMSLDMPKQWSQCVLFVPWGAFREGIPSSCWTAYITSTPATPIRDFYFTPYPFLSYSLRMCGAGNDLSRTLWILRSFYF